MIKNQNSDISNLFNAFLTSKDYNVDILTNLFTNDCFILYNNKTNSIIIIDNAEFLNQEYCGYSSRIRYLDYYVISQIKFSHKNILKKLDCSSVKDINKSKITEFINSEYFKGIVKKYYINTVKSVLTEDKEHLFLNFKKPFDFATDEEKMILLFHNKDFTLNIEKEKILDIFIKMIEKRLFILQEKYDKKIDTEMKLFIEVFISELIYRKEYARNFSFYLEQIIKRLNYPETFEMIIDSIILLVIKQNNYTKIKFDKILKILSALEQKDRHKIINRISLNWSLSIILDENNKTKINKYKLFLETICKDDCLLDISDLIKDYNGYFTNNQNNDILLENINCYLESIVIINKYDCNLKFLNLTRSMKTLYIKNENYDLFHNISKTLDFEPYLCVISSDLKILPLSNFKTE